MSYPVVAVPEPTPAEPFTLAGFESDIPIVGVSLHAAHAVRPEVDALFALSDDERLREEDVGLNAVAAAFEAKVTVHRSRFEVDLNRPPGLAIYAGPREAWGLEVWKRPLPPAVLAGSMELYRSFYRAVQAALERFAKHHPRFVVVDIHSYNHRRAGPEGPATDPALAPEINIGTGTVDDEYWAPVVDACVAGLTRGTPATGPLDVRENVNFKGGFFPAWINATFPRQACAIAVELKKTYTDEWTGRTDRRRLAALAGALTGVAPRLTAALESLTWRST